MAAGKSPAASCGSAGVVFGRTRRFLVPCPFLNCGPFYAARAIDLAIGERCQGPIFLTADGRRLNRHGAGRIIRRVARRAGISKKVGPHTLRHAFITDAQIGGVASDDSFPEKRERT
jgi:integrase